MDKLAIYGGKPVRTKKLPYARQYIDDDDCEAVVKVLKSDFLTTGPMAKQFENEIAEFVNAKYAVAYANGTAALHGACYAADIGKGDEVITSPITFAASANCALYMGATPVFADIDENNFNISVNEIEKKVTSKTKAIIPVDFGGQAVDIDAINAIANKKNLIVIEDGAHSLGTRYKNKYVGGLCDMTEFSFHPVKTITTGEGGMVVTNNSKYYKKLVNFRSHCITRDEEQFVNPNEGGWYYEQLDLGFNYRITDFQSALGISQLRKMDFFASRRKAIVAAYNQAFDGFELLTPCKNEDYSDTVNHLYVVRLNLARLSVNRRQIYDACIAEGIGVHVHYIPVYYHPYYQKLGYKKGLCPKAESLYDSLLTLPLCPAMNDDDVNDVITAVKKVLTYYSK